MVSMRMDSEEQAGRPVLTTIGSALLATAVLAGMVVWQGAGAGRAPIGGAGPAPPGCTSAGRERCGATGTGPSKAITTPAPPATAACAEERVYLVSSQEQADQLLVNLARAASAAPDQSTPPLYARIVVEGTEQADDAIRFVNGLARPGVCLIDLRLS